ncbi:EEF1A lysine methyltransferase 4 isoform X2 [Brienomyrus brachyistius]|uniref:EEF1A lysine methyltransferase 4 isoform X2 n=1 Tax=Brienomyrus brachyistius TaxID=42636 RepID=UPI0020B395E8|nr:EEF1A lysine methyltransferase 4 isoform X2 [Brienomyrus brachyistius]
MEYLPDSNSRYKDVEYWDERYRREESFEWFGDLSKFQHLLEQHVKKDDAILILGCGNSSLSFDMYQRGFHFITNVDYSSVCVETMAGRHFNCPGMTWLKMDARQLEFPEGTFDVVLEKATLDAMMVDERDPWHVSTETANLLHQVLKENDRPPHSAWVCQKRRNINMKPVSMYSSSLSLPRRCRNSRLNAPQLSSDGDLVDDAAGVVTSTGVPKRVSSPHQPKTPHGKVGVGRGCKFPPS